MIRAENLSKTFHDKKRGSVAAADKVSFEVMRGEIFGLLGLNGAGKTTTLRLLAGLLKPDSGTSYICDIDMNLSPEKARARLGFLTGTTGLYGRLKAREMIGYFGLLYGLSKGEAAARTQKFMEILAMVEFAEVKCDKLSAGTKQKVSIARTLIHDPEVLILDEPTAGLDVISGRTVVEFIRQERQKGKAIIFSTHVMHEAEKLCDRIGILHRGRIVDIGSPAQLKERTGCPDMDDAFVAMVT